MRPSWQRLEQVGSLRYPISSKGLSSSSPNSSEPGFSYSRVRPAPKITTPIINIINDVRIRPL